MHELATRQTSWWSGRRQPVRPTEADPLYTEYAELHPGEDAADDVFPAGYLDDVVAVSATAGGFADEDGAAADPRQYVLASSAIDVAAPTYGAVSARPQRQHLPRSRRSRPRGRRPRSRGVVALLRAPYPTRTPPDHRAPVETADGTREDRNPLVGAGRPARRGPHPAAHPRELRGPGPRAELRSAPSRRPRHPAPADPLADARDDAVWFGLLGGAAVVLALLLRPVLARRRG